MKKIAIVALLSVCVTTPALADNSDKFYGAVDLGSASMTNNSLINGSTTTPVSGAVRIAGGYNFSQNFAVEVGYAKLRSSGPQNSTVLGIGTETQTGKGSSAQIAAVGILPLNDAWSLFGKVGLANNRTDYTLTSSYGANVTGSGSSTSLLTGFGFQYNVNSKFTIRGQLESFGNNQIGSGSGVTINTSMMSIGGVYNF